MKVRDIMHGVTIVEPSTSVLEIARIMREKNIGSVLVKLSDVDWGIVTERDIVNKVVAKGLSFKEVKASDIMSELTVTIDAQAPISKASELFNIYHIRRLPVMERGEIIGMITSRDVAKYCMFRSLRAKREYGRREGYFR
ncbi:CBS domain-containing protein [Candidatus Pyrohabitans sp.]